MRSNQTGFTLLELVMVLMITALLGATLLVVWPSQKPNVEGSAQQLAGDLRYMQNLAMTMEQKYRVNFSSSQYTLTQQNGTTAVPHPGGSGSNVITLPSGITLATSGLPNGYIVYDKNGVPYTDNGDPGTQLGSQATITLSGDGESYSVSVEPNTGTVLNPS